MNTPTQKKELPEDANPSLQLDLFQWFLSNNASEVSNTVELWDSIPKYFFTPQLMARLRTESGHADPYKWPFEYQGKPCEVRIQPALVEQKDGRYLAFFPSVTEELVEEALKKILTEQHYALHEVREMETWVRFTLRMIQKELKSKGKTRNLKQIKHAIEVMSACVLVFHVEGKEVWRGSILQDLVTVGRDDYLADTDAHHAARLPLFISHSINKLEYRQFNYRRLMDCKEQLSRWILRRIVNRYRHANHGNDYHLMHSELEQSTALLQQSNAREQRKKVISALEELKSCGALRDYRADPRREGRRIVDMKYTVSPSREFITEQKAANKRHSDAVKKASEAKLPLPVDNLI